MKRASMVWLLLCGIAAAQTGLDVVKSEPNLERRSEKALQYASATLDRARAAYQKDDGEALATALEEIGAAIDLCKKSLDDSGKNPRRSPKYFKKAEIGIRQLIRRLDTFKIEMSVDDRGPVERLLERAHRFQEEILHAIMGKRK